MIHEFDAKLVVELSIGAILGSLIWVGTRVTHKDGKERKIRLAFFTTAINNVLLIIAVVVPVLVGLLSYLYSKAPEGSYSSLFAAITFLFVSLVIAVWITFALLKKASEEERVILRFPKDRRYITAMGLLYVFILVGLSYFALFFLFDLPRPSLSDTGAVLLRKPKAKIGQNRSEIESLWGKPSSSGSVVEYKTPASLIRLIFDASGKLERIDEVKENQ